MRLSIDIDNMRHEIDSTDPELLGKWVVEIFARTGPWSPATMIRVQAFPSFVPDPVTGQARPDWIVDSRITGRIDQVKSPRELLDALAKQLADLDALDT